VDQRGEGFSLLEVAIATGRTHQIRVHLKAIGHSIIGDPLYGEARWKGLESPARKVFERFPRPALHAWRLAFEHPATGERVSFEAPVAEDFSGLWRKAMIGEALPLPDEDDRMSSG
jgi:23S rRNA pseudouridine1911/1915/1917 synthase